MFSNNNKMFKIINTIIRKQTKTISSLTFAIRNNPLGFKTFANLTSNIKFSYITRKKNKNPTPPPIIKLDEAKYSTQKQGFVLYNASQQSFKNKILTVAFLLSLLYGFFTYSNLDDEMKINSLISNSMIAIGFIIFQLRVQKTLKSLVLDKKGQNVKIINFAMGGFKEEVTNAKIGILSSIERGGMLRGNVIKGGGFGNYQKRKYWFNERYIQQKEAFVEIAHGRKVKIQKKL